MLVSVKTRGSHQGAQKHTGFCRGKIKESKLGSPLLPGKEKQNRTKPRKPHGKVFLREISLLYSPGTRRASTQHLPFIFLVVFGYLFLPQFPCVFQGQGMWRYLKNTHPLLTAEQSSPIAEMCPAFTPRELEEHFQPIKPTAHQDRDAQLCLGKSHSDQVPQ